VHVKEMEAAASNIKLAYAARKVGPEKTVKPRDKQVTNNK
jgi:hypothetical protein